MENIRHGSTMEAPRILALRPLLWHNLELDFETGETRVLDVAPYIFGPWRGMLQDEAYFAKVFLYPNGKGLEWPDGQDIAPYEL